jgi:phage shock protein A
MAESIFTRVGRIMSGRLEDRVDEMERSRSDSVMREAIREVDRAIDELRRQQEAAMMRRLQAERQQQTLVKTAAGLTDKAKYALGEGREDLAEGALSRQVELEEQAGKLTAVQEVAKIEEDKLEESLSSLRARKKQMEEALAAFQVAKAESGSGLEATSTVNTNEREHRIENAEAAFDRAMTGGGGIGFSRGDAEAINKVAEIDTMSRRATVAERLAALKSEGSKAA